MKHPIIRARKFLILTAISLLSLCPGTLQHSQAQLPSAPPLFYGRPPVSPYASSQTPIPSPPPPTQVLHYERAPLTTAKGTAAQAVPKLQKVNALQKPFGYMRNEEGEDLGYTIQLEPPGPERLFRVESERMMKERMRQESRTYGKFQRISFPEDPIITKDKYIPRPLKLGPNYLAEVAEPFYVCYHRPYFAQLNPERYGWELGVLQPFVCAGRFYFDAFLLPYYWGTEPFRCYECDRGYCLPGDPVPYLVYPPILSASGLAAQAAVMTGAFFIFP